MDLPKLGIAQKKPQAISYSRTETAYEKQRAAVAKYRSRPEIRETIRLRNLQWRERNREKLRAQYKKYYAENRAKRRAARDRSNIKHAAKIKAARDAHRVVNKDAINKRWRDYYTAHPDKLAEKHRKYAPRRLAIRRLRRLQNPTQRLIDACRTRTLFLLKKAGVPKFNHTFDLIGCTPDFLKAHLESQFESWMNWNNFGKTWEIDHIAAVSRFDISDEAQRLTAFNYKNCRPFRKSDNRSKCNLTHEEWTAKRACALPPACRRAGP